MRAGELHVSLVAEYTELWMYAQLKFPWAYDWAPHGATPAQTAWALPLGATAMVMLFDLNAVGS
ncbi:MAG: hypothetical protein AD742_10400 [Methylibium sp. NZG]|nr:MAG: hypothetical protein AD742_10400 [Methylibium sp. NZG]